jgi:hypothetical protein
VILLGVEPEEIVTLDCGSLELADRVTNTWGVPEERDVPITVCRDPPTTMQRLWELESEDRVH